MGYRLVCLAFPLFQNSETPPPNPTFQAEGYIIGSRYITLRTFIRSNAGPARTQNIFAPFYFPFNLLKFCHVSWCSFSHSFFSLLRRM